MTWWNRKSKPEDEPVVLLPKEPEPGQIVPRDDQEKVLAKSIAALGTPKVKPLPDLSTKPTDIVGYCFGFACPKNHVNFTFENITVDGYKERKVCQKCGAVAKPATVRRIAEAQWGDTAFPGIENWCSEPIWGWYNRYSPRLGYSCFFGDTLWTKYELVHFLDTPVRKSSSRRGK